MGLRRELLELSLTVWTKISLDQGFSGLDSFAKIFIKPIKTDYSGFAFKPSINCAACKNIFYCIIEKVCYVRSPSRHVFAHKSLPA